MQTLTTAIMDRLQSMVPEIAWIDLDVGQLELENPPVDYPCALVDVTDIDFSDMAENNQVGNTTVTISIAQQCITETNYATPLQYRNEAATYFNIIQKVFTALQGFEGNHFAPLTRVTLRKQKKVFPLTYVLGFATALYSAEAETDYPQAAPTPIIWAGLK